MAGRCFYRSATTASPIAGQCYLVLDRGSLPKTHYDAVVTVYAALPNAGVKAKPVRRIRAKRSKPRSPDA
jgi:hypothetical protein